MIENGKLLFRNLKLHEVNKLYSLRLGIFFYELILFGKQEQLKLH